jgi:hypothetical protein
VISLTYVFWMFVILFAIIGAMRGWAKELMVSFSVILAITFINLIENYMPSIQETIMLDPVSLFWMRAGILGFLVFFGYQTPKIPRLVEKFYRERLQDALLGIFIGAINGYLIGGSIWYFLSAAGYPFPIISDPLASGIPAVVDSTNMILAFLPPAFLVVPLIYFIVVIAFIFVLVVFI